MDCTCRLSPNRVSKRKVWTCQQNRIPNSKSIKRRAKSYQISTEQYKAGKRSLLHMRHPPRKPRSREATSPERELRMHRNKDHTNKHTPERSMITSTNPYWKSGVMLCIYLGRNILGLVFRYHETYSDFCLIRHRGHNLVDVKMRCFIWWRSHSIMLKWLEHRGFNNFYCISTDIR